AGRWASMSATKYPFQMVGGVPVVTAPPEIDATTVGQLRAILLEWHTRGHTTVVVDMTGTLFCDSAGLRELVWAHKRGVADGGGGGAGGGGGRRAGGAACPSPPGDPFPACGPSLAPTTPPRISPPGSGPCPGHPPRADRSARAPTRDPWPRRPPCPPWTGSAVRRLIAATVCGAERCSCPNVSTHGSAALAAGPNGTVRTWVILRSRRARWPGRSPR